VVDHDSGRLVWAAPGRDKATLHQFFDALGQERCAAVTHVSADGADWIAAVVADRCPQAVRCADPFHVVAWATDALDEVRRAAWNTARGAVNQRRAGRASGHAKALKGARYALWTNPGNLTDKQQAKLAWVAKTDPSLYRGYLLKEDQEVLALTVFEDLTSPQAARVLGITPPAYRLRLMRARRELRRHLDAADTATACTIDPGECFMRPKAFFDLRSYDVADTALTPDQQQRADAMLERIVTTPTVAPGDLERRAKPRIRPMKLVGILVAAALLAIGMIAFPGSGRSSNAHASWTPTPSPVAAGDLDVVAHACRDKVGDHSGPNGGVSFDSATIPVALAERRGDLVAVLFHQNNPDMAVACVATNRPGSADVDDVNVGAGGSSGPAWTPAPDRITQGTIAQFRNQPAASVTQGAVGTNVATVTIHSAGQTFTATVRDGRYAAWWPGKAFTDAPRQPSGQGGPQVNLTYDVTLTDGTTLTNVTPATP